MDQARIAKSRAIYATSITLGQGVDDPRVMQAFATVPRERFVRDGPWNIFTPSGYVETASADPTLLYQDVVVALQPQKRINNGQPSLHARCLAAARVQAGDRVLHIGCGSGYYTALLAELVTENGSVIAWDTEQPLAVAATQNLRGWAHVTVGCRSGTVSPIPESDVIYVSAGCTQPLKIWADALLPGGRLVFPLTPGWDYGGMLKVTRHANGYDADFVCTCSFIPCDGGSHAGMEAKLREAFSRGGTENVSSLHFGAATRDIDCWFAGDGWWLSSAPNLDDVPYDRPGR